MAWYQPGVVRVGTVESCTTENVVIQFFQNAHELAVPKYRYSPDAIRRLTTQESARVTAVPRWYYTLDWFPRHPQYLDVLEQFLLDFRQYSDQYKRYIYDCSEASAYLEACLEDAGFDARIVMGPAPFPPHEGHAWVHVVLPDYVVAIEATAFFGGPLKQIWNRIRYLFTGKAPGIVYADHPYADAYYNGYDFYCYDIYVAATVADLSEFDWWNL